MLYWCCVASAFGAGPPGIRPPSSFHAEQWYPSNLPTVMPPWKEAGVDIETFRTASPAALTTLAPKTLEQRPTERLLNVTDDLNSEMSNETIVVASTAAALSTTLLTSSTTPAANLEVSTVPSHSSGTTSSEHGVGNATDIVDVVAQMNIVNSTVFDGLNSTSTEEDIDANLLTTSTLESFITEPAEEQTTTATTMTTTTTATTTATTTIPIPTLDFTDNRLANDVPKNITMTGAECSDLFFVLDSSGNVLEQYEKQKLHISNILMQLDDSDRHYGLLTYAGRTRQRMNVPPRLQISKSLFMKKLSRARFLSGVTATGAALRAVAQLDFPHRTDVIVVTDGFSFDSVNAAAQRLRQRPRIRVLVTGNYSPVVKEVLNSIAGDPLNVLLGSRSTQQLLNLLNC